LRFVRWPASGKSKKIAVKKYLTILEVVSRMGLDPGYVSSVSGWLRERKDHPPRAYPSHDGRSSHANVAAVDAMYARAGRPSIGPEKLLRALLVQMLYSIRGERLLMEEIDYSLLFRWFVGLNLDEAVWDTTQPRPPAGGRGG
jgi:hypothetical protein